MGPGVSPAAMTAGTSMELCTGPWHRPPEPAAWGCGCVPGGGACSLEQNRIVDANFRLQQVTPQEGGVCGQVLGLLVPVSFTHFWASTSGLSTQSSSWGPYHVNRVGDLILKQASRLDAFSGYPFRT